MDKPNPTTSRTRQLFGNRPPITKPGHCYENAFWTVVGQSHYWDMIPDGATDIILVQGEPWLADVRNQRYGHAWVEFNYGVVAWVLDASIGQMYWKELYYEAGRIVEGEPRKYTAEEAARKVIEHKHWGPWATTHPGLVFRYD